MNNCGEHVTTTLADFYAMTQEQAGALAECFIWTPNVPALIPSGADVMIVDWIWNSGHIGLKYIQAMLHVTADGIMGPITAKAVATTGAVPFINACYERRVEFLNLNNFQKRFPGLYTRAASCKALAMTLASDGPQQGNITLGSQT